MTLINTLHFFIILSQVDDHLTFPTDLNMLPYTEEGIAAKENKKFEKMYSRDDGEDDSGVCGHSALIKPDAYYQYTLKGTYAHTLLGSGLLHSHFFIVIYVLSITTYVCIFIHLFICVCM